jgi:hypothetical protein
VLPCSFLAQTITKRKNHSNQPKLTTHPIPSHFFNPKRGMRKETPKPREEAFVCMFCGHTGYLDEFCFHHKRIEKRHVDYASNSYHNEFTDFPDSYCHALPRTPSHAMSRFIHGPNHHSYGFDSQENNFVPRRLGYGPRSYHGDRFLHMHGFPAAGSYTHFEPRHLDGPCFFCHGSCSTGSNGEV